MLSTFTQSGRPCSLTPPLKQSTLSKHPIRAVLQLTCQQCREADRIAIEEFGVPSIQLMENAGRGCAKAIQKLEPSGPVVILCGPGNNGGDGFVIARYLREAQIAVSVVRLCEAEKYAGDALINLKRLASVDVPVNELHSNASDAQIERLLATADGKPTKCIVDAMLGTGAKGPLRTPFNSVVRVANSIDAIRVAIDIPTGLDGDSGEVVDEAFRADLTCTFIAFKPCMDNVNGGPYCGVTQLVDIGLPEGVTERFVR